MLSLPRRVARRLARGPEAKRFVVVARALDRELPRYEASIPFSFEILPPDPAIIRSHQSHIPEEHTFDIEQRVAKEHLCCVARHRGAVVFVSWIGLKTGYSYHLPRTFELAEGEAFLYGAYTLPDYRGRGLQPACAARRLRWLHGEGYTRALALIDPKNPAAMRMPQKLNFDRVGASGYYEIFGLRWYYHFDGGAFSALRRRHYLLKV